MTYQVSRMRLTFKRIVQALFVVVLFSFSTLAVLRTIASNPSASHADDVKSQQWMHKFVNFWPDRSLRSIAEDPVLLKEQNEDNEIVFESHPMSVTTQPIPSTTAKSLITLDDVFISVKTTKNFHAVRLDAIIKTWFTLAREQVTIACYCTHHPLEGLHHHFRNSSREKCS